MEDKARYSDLEFLTVRLPEDIEKWKWYGDFRRAEKVIDMRLEKEIPKALRRRLELEKWILRRLPLQYIYTEEQALKELSDTLEGVTREELEELRDEGAAEWIFVMGQVRYKDDFVENLLKTRRDLWARLKDPSKAEERKRGGELLDRTVLAMKEKGGLAFRMRIRASLKVEKEAERAGERIRVHLPVPVEQGQARHVRLLGTSRNRCRRRRLTILRGRCAWRRNWNRGRNSGWNMSLRTIRDMWSWGSRRRKRGLEPRRRPQVLGTERMAGLTGTEGRPPILRSSCPTSGLPPI